MSRLDEFERRQAIVKEHSTPDPYEPGAYESCVYVAPMQLEAYPSMPPGEEVPCPAPERDGSKPYTCRGCYAANFDDYDEFMKALRALLRNSSNN